MPRSWVKDHKNFAIAAVNLRISGVSEAAIYREFHKNLASPPSYGDLRSAFKEYGVQYRRLATSDRRAGLYRNSQGELRKGSSEYLARRRAAFYPKQRKDIEKRQIKMYLATAAKDASEFKEGTDIYEWVQSDYAGPLY